MAAWGFSPIAWRKLLAKDRSKDEVFNLVVAGIPAKTEWTALKPLVRKLSELACTGWRAIGLGFAAMAGLQGDVRQQQRPLHMLLMRGTLPELNGHCVEGARTRVTITTDADSAGRSVWQVGGQIAEDGVGMDRVALIRHGAAEIRAVLLGLDLTGVEWATYRIDRAEDAAGQRPDDVSVTAHRNVIVAWPTKLALVPRLAERINELVDCPPRPEPPAGGVAPDRWPQPEFATPPWERQEQWSIDA